MNHQSIYDVMNQLLDPKFQYDDPSDVLEKPERSPRDFDHDGAIIEYLDMNGEKSYFAMSLGNQYIPFARNAAAFRKDSQIIAVYDYPVEDINEAFWNQRVESSKLIPLWERHFAEDRRKIKDLDKKIEERKKERARYSRQMPVWALSDLRKEA